MNAVEWLPAFAQRCRVDLLERVVPFWYEHSIDHQYGGFYSCLEHDGAVYDDRKYVWLQGRAVWMFARLYNEVEARPEWLEAAARGLGFLRAHAIDSRGRLFFSLTRRGEPLYFQRKPYGAVFYLLALVEYHRATGEEEWLQEARKLFARIVGWIEDPSLLDRPRQDGQPAASNLADVMVLAGMASELMRVDPDPCYLRVMEEALRTARRHVHPERGILLERAPLETEPGTMGSAWVDWPESRLFCPGHSIEVAWFLLHLLEFVEDDAGAGIALRALAGSLEFGWDDEFGGLYYFMDVEGRPPLQLEASMKLWWPHSEALYALVLAYQRTREPRWLQWLEKVETYTRAHFEDTQAGGWFGYCDRRGVLTHTCKGGNYKGFFHVPRALLMCMQCSEALVAAGDAG